MLRETTTSLASTHTTQAHGDTHRPCAGITQLNVDPVVPDLDAYQHGLGSAGAHRFNSAGFAGRQVDGVDHDFDHSLPCWHYQARDVIEARLGHLQTHQLDVTERLAGRGVGDDGSLVGTNRALRAFVSGRAFVSDQTFAP